MSFVVVVVVVVVPVVSKAQGAMVSGVANAAREIVTPIILSGGCSPKFDLVPVKTAKTTFSAVSELLTRCKQNTTGRDVAIAAATIATIAAIAGTAYYMWSKPAVNLATAVVGAPVAQAAVPGVENSVDQADAPNFVDQADVPGVENSVDQADVSASVQDASVAQPSSYYSYVSGLCGTAWNKVKSCVVTDMKKTRTKEEKAVGAEVAAVNTTDFPDCANGVVI